MTTIDKVYVDCSKGAIDCLKDLTEGVDFNGCSAIPDSFCAGVWKVILPNMPHNMIVFMKGYKEPSGEIREYNDCMDCDW